MPYLDADALTEDPKGLEFLAQVLESDVAHAAPRWAVAVEAAPVDERVVARNTARRGRERVPLAPEAA